MNEDQIISVFIKAAEVDRKLPNTARPARFKAMNHGYIHDVADMNGWFADDKHAANWAWLDPEALRNTTNDMGLWNAAMELMKLVPCPKKRRALWAWAASEAGGQSFAKWCRSVEGISRQLGDWRKSSAIKCIFITFSRNALQHNGKEIEPDFTNQVEKDDKTSNIRVFRHEENLPGLKCDEGLRDFSWAEAQNERRRQRDAKRRQAA
jgi:hypothetical protein